MAKLREGGASWERDCDYYDRRLDAILIHPNTCSLATPHASLQPSFPNMGLYNMRFVYNGTLPFPIVSHGILSVDPAAVDLGIFGPLSPRLYSIIGLIKRPTPKNRS